MRAILSDIHGNLEALQAVLMDVAALGVRSIYCLGDLVGYGPNPRECVDLAFRWELVLLGNFESWLLADTVPLVSPIERYLLWSQAQLDLPIPDAAAAQHRRAFLEKRPRWCQERDLLFVHGSPRNPLHDYVFPEDIYCERKMEEIFTLVERYCLMGHTHVPGIVTEDRRFLSPEEIGGRYHLDGRKILCNVGSVGQPRDGDWRACYVLLDANTIQFRRIEYDVEVTIGKVHAIDALDDFQGDRLREGR